MNRLSLATAPWRFRDCATQTWLPATVPGCVHTDLRRANAIPDPFYGTNELSLQWIEERDWEYVTEFEVPAALLSEEMIELVADGLDTVATVRLNGQEIARTENMFISHRWDVKSLLRAGANELSIRFDSAMRYIREKRTTHVPREFNDPVGRCQVIRKQQCQFGWDWGPRFVTAGIWRDLRIEGWSTNRLVSVQVTQEHTDDGCVSLHLSPPPNLARIATAPRSVIYRLKLGGIVVADGFGKHIRVAHPQLWWPNGHGSQPALHPRRRNPHRRGHAPRHVDQPPRPAHDRTRPPRRRRGRDVPIQGQRAAPSSPRAPTGSRPTPSSPTSAARTTRATSVAPSPAHMNMIRVWGGGIYESEDFYDLCDELGLLVWQDFMFACSLYPGDRAFVKSVETEADQQVRRLRHRACLALWWRQQRDRPT